MAEFHGEPHTIIEALMQRRPPPPVSTGAISLLVGPGLEQLCRAASQREIVLWQTLTAPVPLTTFLCGGYNRVELASLLQAGIVEAANGAVHRADRLLVTGEMEV